MANNLQLIMGIRLDKWNEDKYTPENMAKTRIAPEFAGILLNKMILTTVIADSGCTSTIFIL